MLLLASLAMMLCAGGPAEPPAAVPADEVTRAEKALAAYQSMNMLEAASAFEGLWADFRVPGYLFNAAVARERLGHEAHAYLHLREYLAASIGTDEREAAERRLQELKLRAVPLRIEMMGGAVQGLRLTAQKRPNAETLEIEEPLVAVPGVAGAYELYVEAGEWRVTSSAPGYRDVEATASVQPGSPATLQLRLQALTVPFALVIGPPAALSAGTAVRFTPKAGGEPITHTIAEGQNEWQLPPGAYAVTVTAAGFEPSSFDLDLQPDKVPPTTLSLIPLVVPAKDDMVDRRFTIGLGLASGVLLVSGGVTLVVSMPRFGAVRDDYLAISEQVPVTFSGRQWNDAYLAMRQNVRVQTAGFVLAGGGVGAGIATALTKVKNRRRVVAAEVGAGAVALVGSLVTYAVVHGRQGSKLQADEQIIEKHDDQDRPQPRDGMLSSSAKSLNSGVAGSDAAAFFIGAGGALLTAGVVEWALLSRNRQRPTVAVGTTANRHGGMLTISGNF